MSVSLRPFSICASILAADFGELRQAVRSAERHGIDSIHVDIMDGHYVHNFTFGIDLIPALRRCCRLPLAVHLEIDNPDGFIADFAKAGADTIIVCEDTCPDVHATIRASRAAGVRIGVSLNPDRPLDLVRDYVDQIDLLLILAVFPGFGGQELIPATLPKIRAARELLDRTPQPPRLGVDGGVNRETVADVLQAGADTLVIGSALYRGDVAENVRTIQTLIATAEAPAGD